MKKLTHNEVYIKAKQLLLPSALSQICAVLNIDVYDVMSLSIHKKYNTFKVPKGNNDFRIIEAPQKELMEILKIFNFYLQAAYYTHQTKVSYGFIMSIRYEKTPKNILENAKKHLGNQFMLKIDLQDFFHQISDERLKKIFKTKPFGYNASTAHTLSQLFTYNGRLPMGSPTSPALSNFAVINLDNDLALWANTNKVTFTRFADDMTFSSNIEITKKQLAQITNICKAHEYIINTSKTKFYKKDDVKIVTGLVLNQQVNVQEEFFIELEQDLKRLKSLVEVTIITKQGNYDKTFIKFQQEIKGKINFIGMIEGYYGINYIKYNSQYKAIMHPTNEKLFSRWTHFNYF